MRLERRPVPNRTSNEASSHRRVSARSWLRCTILARACGQDVAMRSRLITGSTILALALAACGGSERSVAGPTTKLTLFPPTTTTQTFASTTTVQTNLTMVPTTTQVEVVDVTTTTRPAPTTTTAPLDPAVEALVLSDEGIGAAVFSGDPDGVVAFLDSFLGPPTADTGWVDPFEISNCAGTQLRVVSYNSLSLTFGDVSPVLEGRRHFFAYTYGNYDFDGTAVAVSDKTPLGLVTDNNVGLGTQLDVLEVAYPDLQINPADDFFPETFVINDNLRGVISGLADDSEVVRIIGGQDCAEPT